MPKSALPTSNPPRSGSSTPVVEHTYGDADSADLPLGDPGVPRGPGRYRGWRTFPALMKAGKLPMSGEGGEVNLEWVSRAPGRLDLLGGVADVGGALTLQYPLCEAGVEVRMRVTLGPRGPGQPHEIRVWDESGEEFNHLGTCQKFNISPILETVDVMARDCRARESDGSCGEPESRPTDEISPVTKEALKMLGKLPGGWAHHVVGCILGFHVQGSSLGWCLSDIGESAKCRSNRRLNWYPPWTLLEVFTGPGAGSVAHLPPGQGGASSAAVQIATLRCYWGVLLALDLHFATEEAAVHMNFDTNSLGSWRDFEMHEHFAVLAQAVENFAVGSPCGIMDQVACSCGREGQLLPVWCSLENKFEVAKRSYDFSHQFELQPPGKKRRRGEMNESLRRDLLQSGGANRLAWVLAYPGKSLGTAMVVGWPSGKKHSHVGSQSPYSIARAALFMGKALVGKRVKTKTPFPWESQHGLRGETPGEALRQAIDPPLSSGFSLGSPCIAEEGKQVVEGPCEGTGRRSLGSVLRHYIGCLPERLSGRDFKAQCAEPLADPLSFVEDETLYPVRAAFSFSVEANEQAEVSLLLLQSVVATADFSRRKPRRSSQEQETWQVEPRAGELAALKAVGEMMFKQHRSYSDMGLGSSETDEIVAFLRTKFPHDVFGARVGGGGCGGTVVILCKREAFPAIREAALARVRRADGGAGAGPALRLLV